MSARARSSIGLYAIVAAAAGVLLAPLIAIAYFGTADGVEQLEAATVAAWAVPGRDLAGGLVTWASADRVYATYSQVMAVLFPAVVLTALAVRSLRPLPRKRSERIGWRIALTGYTLFAAGTVTFGIAVIPSDTSGVLDDVAFVAMMLPGMLLMLIGSTVLGIVFIRSGYQPRLTAWLLASAIPLFVVGNIVMGHNGFGVVPLVIAWAATGWRWRAAGSTTPAEPVGEPLAGHA